jgi:hypothetical protein
LNVIPKTHRGMLPHHNSNFIDLHHTFTFFQTKSGKNINHIKIGGNGITENPPSGHKTSIICPSSFLTTKVIYLYSIYNARILSTMLDEGK